MNERVKVTQLCPILCDPMDYLVHGILQARILKWVAVPFSRESSQPRDQTQVSCIAGGFFTSWVTREAHHNMHTLRFRGINKINEKRPQFLTWLDKAVHVLYRKRKPATLNRKVKVLVSQLCLTLCDPINCSPPVAFLYILYKGRKSILYSLWKSIHFAFILYLQ